MTAFLQSHFLQALGYTIANSFWQAAILWILVIIIKSILRISSSKKYALAVLAQVAGVIWFIYTLSFYFSYISATDYQQQIINGFNNSLFKNGFESATFALLIQKSKQLLPYFSLAYIFVFFLLIIRLGKAFISTRRLVSNGLIKADVNLRLYVNKTANHLNIKKQIKVYVSTLVNSPLTSGFFKPLILIPIACINQLSTEQLEAVLLHELAHIKRADFLLNILQSIIETVLFFNPFIHLIGKVIKQERENSCDDCVLQFQFSPAMYVKALLKIASAEQVISFAMNAATNEGALLLRIRRMLNKKENQYSNYLKGIPLLFITLIIAYFISANAASTHTNTNVSEYVKNKNFEKFLLPVSYLNANNFVGSVYLLNGSLKTKTDVGQRNQNTIIRNKISERTVFSKEENKEGLSVKKLPKKQTKNQNTVSADNLKSNAIAVKENLEKSVMDFSVFERTNMAFSPIAISYKFSDTLKNASAGLIIIKHDPANDNSYIKKLIIEIISKTGVREIYDCEVKVYQ